MALSLYTRPNKPYQSIVKARKALSVVASAPSFIEVDSITECYVTPEHSTNRMVQYLDGAGEGLHFNQQAGTGNLITALLADDENTGEIIAVECR